MKYHIFIKSIELRSSPLPYSEIEFGYQPFCFVKVLLDDDACFLWISS